MTKAIKDWDADLWDVLDSTRDKWGYRYCLDPFKTRDGYYAGRISAFWAADEQFAMRVAWNAVQRYAKRRSDVVVWAEEETHTICVKYVIELATQVSLDDIPVPTQTVLDGQ